MLIIKTIYLRCGFKGKENDKQFQVVFEYMTNYIIVKVVAI